jgi:hypothetical protein
MYFYASNARHQQCADLPARRLLRQENDLRYEFKLKQGGLGVSPIDSLSEKHKETNGCRDTADRFPSIPSFLRQFRLLRLYFRVLRHHIAEWTRST